MELVPTIKMNRTWPQVSTQSRQKLVYEEKEENLNQSVELLEKYENQTSSLKSEIKNEINDQMTKEEAKQAEVHHVKQDDITSEINKSAPTKWLRLLLIFVTV
jgi:nucleosome binding factor SPN SPT16 subunit